MIAQGVGAIRMARSRWLWTSTAVCGVMLAGMAGASENTTYTYDALGRLVATARSGGPHTGVAMATCFDPAGNRTAYAVATSGGATCAAATPTPTPTNLPPVAVNDSTSMMCNTTSSKNLVLNDSDPDGNVPLSLVSITQISGSADAPISSSTTVALPAYGTGTTIFHYVVSDSLGATATGTRTVSVTGTHDQCFIQ